MYSPELDKIIEEADNPFEAFFAVLIYALVELIFRAVEVILGEPEYGSH